MDARTSYVPPTQRSIRMHPLEKQAQHGYIPGLIADDNSKSYDSPMLRQTIQQKPWHVQHTSLGDGQARRTRTAHKYSSRVSRPRL